MRIIVKGFRIKSLDDKLTQVTLKFPASAEIQKRVTNIGNSFQVLAISTDGNINPSTEVEYHFIVAKYDIDSNNIFDVFNEYEYLDHVQIGGDIYTVFYYKKD